MAGRRGTRLVADSAANHVLNSYFEERSPRMMARACSAFQCRLFPRNTRRPARRVRVCPEL